MDKKNFLITRYHSNYTGYETPCVSVIEIDPEGVLCQSGQLEEWEEGVIPW